MNGARIFLGVSGGIAAYKAAALTSTLVQRGAIVDVVMTAEAERFITPLTFASLTARPVYHLVLGCFPSGSAHYASCVRPKSRSSCPRRRTSSRSWLPASPTIY